MKYKVYITRHECGQVIVEAQDEEEAKQIADDFLEDYYNDIFEPGNAVYEYESEEYKGEE